MSSPRKAAKGKGVDGEESRRSREDKVIQIRKDKRTERSNLQRQRYQEITEESDAVPLPQQLPAFRRRNLESLPLKRELLLHPDIQQQIEGATYFRKILAADKNPPVQAIVEAGVVPILVEFLTRFDSPTLQLEAAWAITNIACGDVEFARSLISCGVTPRLIDLIVRSPDVSVREQSMWAISNMSADVAECRDLLLEVHTVDAMLWQLGIECPAEHQRDAPSLMAMRHISWTLSNLLRGRPPTPPDIVVRIVQALCDLLQSTDNDIIRVIIGGFIYLCETTGPLGIQLLMEHGVYSRIRELFETRLCDCKLECVRLVAAALRYSNLLQKKIILCGRCGPVIEYRLTAQYLVRELHACETASIAIELSGALKEAMSVESVGGLLQRQRVETALQMDLQDSLYRLLEIGNFDLRVEAGACLTLLLRLCPPESMLLCSRQALSNLADLLSTTDLGALMDVLAAVARVAEAVGRESEIGTFLDSSGIQRHVELLMVHPNEEVAARATRVEESLSRLNRAQELGDI